MTSSLCDIPSISGEEIAKFETRFENGYDLQHDERYNFWLRTYHPDEVPLQPSVQGGDVSVRESLTYHSPSILSSEEDSTDGGQDGVLMPTVPTSSISKFLQYPPPPSQLPTLKPRSSGRVLTSAECLKMMEEKQQEREAKARQKEERRQKREEKAKSKVAAASGDGRVSTADEMDRTSVAKAQTRKPANVRMPGTEGRCA